MTKQGAEAVEMVGAQIWREVQTSDPVVDDVRLEIFLPSTRTARMFQHGLALGSGSTPEGVRIWAQAAHELMLANWTVSRASNGHQGCAGHSGTMIVPTA
jgi:hypothetical protein